MPKTKKIDQFIHKKAQQGLQLAKRGAAAVSKAAQSAKKSIEEGDSFLTEEQHHKIDKAAQDLKEKVKKFWNK